MSPSEVVVDSPTMARLAITWCALGFRSDERGAALSLGYRMNTVLAVPAMPVRFATTATGLAECGSSAGTAVAPAIRICLVTRGVSTPEPVKPELGRVSHTRVGGTE